ncbi:DDE-type integrase/transposase/recombinase [Bacillus thuringiensis]
MKTTTDSRRVDEIYIKIKSETMYLYRLISYEGSTIDFLLKS